MTKKETLRCTECDRPVVNRLVDDCLYCGASLDEEMTLSKEEKARLREKEMRELDAQRKARIERDEEHSGLIGSGSSDGVLPTLGLFGLMSFFD